MVFGSYIHFPESGITKVGGGTLESLDKDPARPEPCSRYPVRADRGTPKIQGPLGSFAVFVGTEGSGAFCLGAAGSSSVGAVSGVSTLILRSTDSCSSDTTLTKSVAGVPVVAPFMNSSQMGRAA